MSDSKRKNPSVRSGEESFTIRLKDSRGRYTKVFSEARSFSIVSKNKRLSQWRKFDPSEKTATQKRLSVLTKIEVHERQKKIRAEKARLKRTGQQQRTRKGKKATKVTGRLRKEAAQRAADIVHAPKPRKKKDKLQSNSEFAKNVEKLLREVVESRRDIPSQADPRLLNERLIVRLNALKDSGLVHISSVSTNGRKTKLQPKKDKRGRVVKKKNGDPVMVQAESPFDVAKDQGIRPEGHLWTIARNYLTKHFDDLLMAGMKQMQQLATFGVVVTTNLPGWEGASASTQFGGTISFFPIPGDFQAKRQAIDSMTYQLVNALVKTMNSATEGEYIRGSVTSSGKFYQRLMEVSGQSHGKKWTATPDFRLAFTLISGLEEF
jgi:hypothetical protein